MTGSVSVVIPTHNRCDTLPRCLNALAEQDWPMPDLEVIVVADACEDKTADVVQHYIQQVPYRLSLLSHEAHSAAATRNLGASRASGSMLLFVDDDVVAQPGFIQAHMGAQRPNRVVLGYSKPVFSSRPSWWQQDARRWWEDTFHSMGELGHRFTYRDFFSGNVSMSAPLFHQVKGFDASIKGRLEDYELGMRLLKAKAEFQFAPQAIGLHYETNDLERWIRRIRQEGTADIQIGDRHPELRTTMFGFTEPKNRNLRRMRQIAFDLSDRGIRQGDRIERGLLGRAARHERRRLRKRWRKDIRLLREFNYWRGVATAIGSQRAFYAWLHEAPILAKLDTCTPVIDIAATPSQDALAQILEQANHTGVRLAVHGAEIMAIPPQPGAEPLQKKHLQAALRKVGKQQFIPGLALDLIQRHAFDAIIGGAS